MVFTSKKKNDCTWYAIMSKIQCCFSSHRFIAWLGNKTGNVYDQVLLVFPLYKIRIITFLVLNHKLINLPTQISPSAGKSQQIQGQIVKLMGHVVSRMQP